MKIDGKDTNATALSEVGNTVSNAPIITVRTSHLLVPIPSHLPIKTLLSKIEHEHCLQQKLTTEQNRLAALKKQPPTTISSNSNNRSASSRKACAPTIRCTSIRVRDVFEIVNHF